MEDSEGYRTKLVSAFVSTLEKVLTADNIRVSKAIPVPSSRSTLPDLTLPPVPSAALPSTSDYTVPALLCYVAYLNLLCTVTPVDDARSANPLIS